MTNKVQQNGKARRRKAVKPRRVLVLIREGLEPPDDVSGLDEDGLKVAPWKTERDVIETLKQLGHIVQSVSVHDDLRVIRDVIDVFKPHVAFNLLEEFAGHVLFDQNVVTFLELLNVPYTGCNPRGLVLSRDKAVTKKLLSYHRIRVPAFTVFERGRRVKRPRGLEFPLFVKSVTEDASLAIAQASLVKDDEALAARVAFVHEHAQTAAMAEEFVDGRELYVGALGNQRLQLLPVWELLFTNKPEGVPLIATARAKWSASYQKKWGVISEAAQDLPEDVERVLGRQCKRIYRILGMSGYARLDFRLREDGTLFFLEANANPQIARDEDFAQAALTAGIEYPELLERLLRLGMARRPWD
ncbi:MAG: D-alanine--D-alanine ligase [Pseudomonadota bacterium]